MTARSSLVALSLALAACGGINFGSSDGGQRGCSVDGGANEGVKQPGNQPGGVDLAYGDLAVAPDGSFVVFEQDARLAVAWTKSGVVEVLPVALPSRLAFAQAAHVVYVSSTFDGAVHAIDVDAGETLWAAPVGALDDGFLAVTEDDAHVAFAASRTLWVLEGKDGHVVKKVALESPVVDLEILPDERRVLAVEMHVFAPNAELDRGAPVATTRIDVLDLETGDLRVLSVPNCSDDVVVTGDGKRAFLAPTFCPKDPISVIDLTAGKESFVKNLPGFGPVVLAPDGNTAVGFFDANQVDAALFDDPSAIPPKGAFHLMVIEPAKLTYAFYEYGPVWPRYATTPNGKLLLVDDDLGSTPARLFDLETRAFEAIEGPALGFEQLALSSDSRHAYVLSKLESPRRRRGRGRAGRATTAALNEHDLYDLDLAAAKASPLPVGFRPWNVNIAPDDRSLFLRKDDHDLCVFSLETLSCERNLVLTIGL